MKTYWITALFAPALGPVLGLMHATAARADAQPDNSAAIDQAVIAKLAAADGTRSKVLAHIDLTERFNTRSQWTLVVAQQLAEDATSRDGAGDPLAAVSVCWVKGQVPDCSDERFLAQYRKRGVVQFSGERAFYQLFSSRIVASRPGGQHPLLELRTCTLQGATGGCGKATFLYRYDETSDSFRTAFFAFTGTNNNQETRFIENGPLRGQVVTVTPTPDAPFGYFVELYRADAAVQHYSRVLKYRSRTRYDDGNALPVIDSEMPELLKREGLWKKGQALPTPPVLPAGCSALALRKGVEWCEARLDGNGFGLIRVGQRADQLPIALVPRGRELVPFGWPPRLRIYLPSGACRYAFPDKQSGFALMMEHGQLSRIDVLLPGIKTDKGVAVGDPIDAVKAAYGDAAVEGRNADDERLLEYTVTSADGAQALRFSTDNDHITVIVAGRAEAVARTDGCL